MNALDSIKNLILLAAAFLAILAARPACAQQAAPTVDTRAMTDASTTKTAAITLQRPATAKNLTFNWKGAPADKVLDDLAAKTNLTIHRDTPVTGTIDMVSLKPLDTDEAVDLLNDALTQKGYAAMVHDRDLHIMYIGGDRVRRKTTVVTVAEAKNITDQKKVFTLIIPILHAPAPRLVENLRSLVPPETEMVAVESSNAILVTDTIGKIRRVQDIVTKLDISSFTPPAFRINIDGGTSTTRASATPAPTATPTSAQVSETARLMMERRRQETGQ